MKLKRESKKESSFLMNGSMLLEEMIASCDGKSNPIRIFSSKHLINATNNYDPHHQICKAHDKHVFRGSLEGRTISVTKEGGSQQSRIKEVVIASQMSSHKNVLKLLGCCLETQIPILVYEFVGNTTLDDHIHAKEEGNDGYPLLLPLPWESKLRIATEIADAVTYLHTAFPKSIIHMDIKPSNVFLDQHYVAKLSGFELSTSIPLGEPYVEATLAGTYGFIAPEATITGRFTEKIDVYGFGALLREILTGKKTHDIYREVLDTLRGDESDIWTRHSSWDELDEAWKNVSEQFLRDNIVIQGNAEQLKECAELSLRCLKLNPEERPTTMKEVAQELRRIKRVHLHHP